MMFCFSTYSSVLLQCKKPSITQREFISTLFSIVGSDDLNSALDESAISNFVNGKKNLSREIVVYARSCKGSDVAHFFDKSIIPLLNQNKIGNLVLAMKDLIANDYNIDNSTIVEYASRQTKETLLKSNNIFLDLFLSGLFLYAIVNTKNKNTKCFVESITPQYISAFDSKKQKLHFFSNETSIQPESYNSIDTFDYFFDDDTLEEARIFCIEHEDDLHLLPICEIAAILNPKHKHINPTINDFNKKNKKLQKAILVVKGIRPYRNCTHEKINECLNEFEKEITEKKYYTIHFLYDSAKYFHRALECYPDYKPEKMNPYGFKRKYVSDSFSNVYGNLRCYIEDYEYGLKHHPEDINIPPFDFVWHKYNLANCDEKTFVFWINRFIVTVCHYLHGFDCGARYNENWRYKDIVDESKLSTMEELYYYAVFLLYKSYSDEKEEVTV